ncbi:Hypothetical protein SRAE_1000096200 [Strongyloides ratti]|uniref:Phytanoyl-CoA hydroxylase-interacting protein-like C-terminal domain-containing protein n=1 Tax=Strongyloides ratti TaxID=34506 RepID=A0A090L3P9_STRRB|nr:Hypothetical protein SRAE_1000096200 [Strongyloides ratti]CEF62692.1 Hypothetical protein SRAE_1000096200 [Strongyloides ratti]
MSTSDNFKEFNNIYYSNEITSFRPDCVRRKLDLTVNENLSVTIHVKKILEEIPNSEKGLIVKEKHFFGKSEIREFKVDERDDLTLAVKLGIEYEYYFIVFDQDTKEKYIYKANYDCMLTKSKIQKLYVKSCELLLTTKYEPIKIDKLYRCKPQLYFENVKNLNNGMMSPYIKDNTGHSGHPLTGKVRGLFFSGILYQKSEFPRESGFGDVRFIIDADLLLNPEFHNYYFSDIYCCNKNKTHFLVIVICKKDTKENDYCKKHLVSLLPNDNDFLFYIHDGNKYNYYWCSAKSEEVSLRLELFYCGNINVYDGAFEKVIPLKNCGATPGGIGCNNFCNICRI